MEGVCYNTRPIQYECSSVLDGERNKESERRMYMITGQIVRQHLKLNDTHVVADTIDYLEAKFVFRTDDWDGLGKWVHFTGSDGTMME